MKATAQKIENNLYVLDVEVEADKFSTALDKVYKRAAKKVNIPGFRKGKAPMTVVKRYLNTEAIVAEALDDLLPSAYYEAVMQTEIEPIDRPDVEVVQAEEGQPVVLKITVAVKPEVELGQYKGIEATKTVNTVSDEDVEKELNNLQNRHAKVVTLEEGKVEKGDTALIDFEGFVDGIAFEGGKGENYSLEIGSGTFIPGFEEALIGAEIGGEVDVNVTFPEEYHAENLKGQPAVFKCKVHSVKRKELLPLDDEFAKDVSEFETLDELKADLKNKLVTKAEQDAENQVLEQIIEQVVANATVELPAVMIETRLDSMVNEIAQRLQYQGISLEQYLQFLGTNETAMRAEIREEAEKGVRKDLVLEAVARAEQIDATETEIEAEINSIAENTKQDIEKLKQTLEAQGTIDYIKNKIAFDKTVKFLKDSAKLA